MSGDRNQQKSDEPEGRRHLSEENDRAVDELEFEQRLPGKRLEDSDGSRSKRDGCGRELDEREMAGCAVPELHPTRIIPPRQSPTAGTRYRGNPPRKIEIPTDRKLGPEEYTPLRPRPDPVAYRVRTAEGGPRSGSAVRRLIG